MEREIEEMHKTVEVGGYRYLISHPDPESAWKMGIELMTMIGEPVAVLSQLKDKKVDTELEGKIIGSAVSKLLSKIGPSESFSLVKRLLKTVELQGKVDGENKKMLLDEAGIKVHFHGRMGPMIKLVSAVVEFTQKDFFDAVTDGIAEMMSPGGKE